MLFTLGRFYNYFTNDEMAKSSILNIDEIRHPLGSAGELVERTAHMLQATGFKATIPVYRRH